MAANKPDLNTPNNDVGLYIGKSRRRVTAGALIQLPEFANWLKPATAGTIVWKNSLTDETSVTDFEAGEMLPIVCDQILVSATIDGVLETTTNPLTFLWMTSASAIYK